MKAFTNISGSLFRKSSGTAIVNEQSATLNIQNVEEKIKTIITQADDIMQKLSENQKTKTGGVFQSIQKAKQRAEKIQTKLHEQHENRAKNYHTKILEEYQSLQKDINQAVDHIETRLKKDSNDKYRSCQHLIKELNNFVNDDVTTQAHSQIYRNNFILAGHKMNEQNQSENSKSRNLIASKRSSHNSSANDSGYESSEDSYSRTHSTSPTVSDSETPDLQETAPYSTAENKHNSSISSSTSASDQADGSHNIAETASSPTNKNLDPYPNDKNPFSTTEYEKKEFALLNINQDNVNTKATNAHLNALISFSENLVNNNDATNPTVEHLAKDQMSSDNPLYKGTNTKEPDKKIQKNIAQPTTTTAEDSAITNTADQASNTKSTAQTSATMQGQKKQQTSTIDKANLSVNEENEQSTNTLSYENTQQASMDHLSADTGIDIDITIPNTDNEIASDYNTNIAKPEKIPSTSETTIAQKALNITEEINDLMRGHRKQRLAIHHHYSDILHHALTAVTKQNSSDIQNVIKSITQYIEKEKDKNQSTNPKDERLQKINNLQKLKESLSSLLNLINNSDSSLYKPFDPSSETMSPAVTLFSGTTNEPKSTLNMLDSRVRHFQKDDVTQDNSVQTPQAVSRSNDIGLAQNNDKISPIQQAIDMINERLAQNQEKKSLPFARHRFRSILTDALAALNTIKNNNSDKDALTQITQAVQDLDKYRQYTKDDDKKSFVLQLQGQLMKIEVAQVDKISSSMQQQNNENEVSASTNIPQKTDSDQAINTIPTSLDDIRADLYQIIKSELQRSKSTVVGVHNFKNILNEALTALATCYDNQSNKDTKTQALQKVIQDIDSYYNSHKKIPDGKKRDLDRIKALFNHIMQNVDSYTVDRESHTLDNIKQQFALIASDLKDMKHIDGFNKIITAIDAIQQSDNHEAIQLLIEECQQYCDERDKDFAKLLFIDCVRNLMINLKDYQENITKKLIKSLETNNVDNNEDTDEANNDDHHSDISNISNILKQKTDNLHNNANKILLHFKSNHATSSSKFTKLLEKVQKIDLTNKDAHHKIDKRRKECEELIKEYNNEPKYQDRVKCLQILLRELENANTILKNTSNKQYQNINHKLQDYTDMLDAYTEGMQKLQNPEFDLTSAEDPTKKLDTYIKSMKNNTNYIIETLQTMQVDDDIIQAFTKISHDLDKNKSNMMNKIQKHLEELKKQIDKHGPNKKLTDLIQKYNDTIKTMDNTIKSANTFKETIINQRFQKLMTDIETNNTITSMKETAQTSKSSSKFKAIYTMANDLLSSKLNVTDFSSIDEDTKKELCTIQKKCIEWLGDNGANSAKQEKTQQIQNLLGQMGKLGLLASGEINTGQEDANTAITAALEEYKKHTTTTKDHSELEGILNIIKPYLDKQGAQELSTMDMNKLMNAYNQIYNKIITTKNAQKQAIDIKILSHLSSLIAQQKLEVNRETQKSPIRKLITTIGNFLQSGPTPVLIGTAIGMAISIPAVIALSATPAVLILIPIGFAIGSAIALRYAINKKSSKVFKTLTSPIVALINRMRKATNTAR